MLRSLFLIVVSLIAFACAKDKAKEAPTSPPPAAPAVTDGSSAGSAAGSAMAGSGSADTGSAAGSGSAVADDEPKSEFDKLSHDDKVKLMKQKVMPAMKAAFQKFDAKEYANFTCKTCHGKDPQKSKYEMPTADLPKLDFEKLKAGKQEPKMAEFMSKVVKPEMAKILGAQEMTETQKGFGCLSCHMMKEKS